jgi:hypothetical protein
MFSEAAVDALPQDASLKTIVIKPGRYYERVLIPKNKPNVTLRGDDADPSKTILTYDLWASKLGEDGKPIGTRNSAGVVVNAADFTAINITFENPSGEKGQAVSVRTTGDKQIFRNCRFLGGQDTLYANGGHMYFDRCYSKAASISSSDERRPCSTTASSTRRTAATSPRPARRPSSNSATFSSTANSPAPAKKRTWAGLGGRTARPRSFAAKWVSTFVLKVGTTGQGRKRIDR